MGKRFWIFVALLASGVIAYLVAVNRRPPLDVTFVVTAEPEQPEIMLDEPGYVSFRVTNPSKRKLELWERVTYRDWLGPPNGFHIAIEDERGMRVPGLEPRGGTYGFPIPRPLAAEGEHVFRLFLPHWVKFKKPGRYTLTITTEIEIDDESRSRENYFIPASATTTVTVIPTDAERLGEIISQTGALLLGDKPNRPHQFLLAMHDERIIPYYVELSARPDRTDRLKACEALKAYDTDEAIAALQRLAETSPKDLDDDRKYDGSLKEGADKVRNCAIEALSARRVSLQP